MPGPHNTLKDIEDPKEFLFKCGPHLLILTILEINTNNIFKYLLIYFKITIVITLHANINNMFYEKQPYFTKA